MRDFPSVSYLAHARTPSRFARYFCYCSLLVIVIVSLYPFSGWHYNGAPLFAYLFYPLPHYQTVFDNTINVLAYVPLGLCLVLLLPHKRSGWLLAIAGGLLVSGTMEFIQQFLPSRIASNLDILSNGTGTLIGAVLGLIAGHERWRRQVHSWRHAKLAPGPAGEWGFVWLVLWFITQLDPVQPFLGVVVIPQGLPQPFESPLANPALFLALLEGGGMMLHLVGVSLFVSLLVRHSGQIPATVIAALLLALLAKMTMAGMLLQPEQFFAWVNTNIAIGGMIGLLCLLLLWRLRRRLRAAAGLLALLAAQVVSWLWPLTPQFSATLPLFRWQYGHLQHLSGLTHIIGDIWPIGAMLWLAWMMVRPMPHPGWNDDRYFTRY